MSPRRHLLPALLAGLALAGCGTDRASSDFPADGKVRFKLDLIVDDSSISPSYPRIPASGVMEFTFRNQGEEARSIAVETRRGEVATGSIPPRGQKTIKVYMEPGEYDMQQAGIAEPGGGDSQSAGTDTGGATNSIQGLITVTGGGSGTNLAPEETSPQGESGTGRDTQKPAAP